MSIANQDFDAKARLGYVEKKSRVFTDGRERLVGKDWKRRKEELAERSGGRCEYTSKQSWGWRGGFAQRCWEAADDPHHEILRSVSRDDRLANLKNYCRTHHMLVDAQQRLDKRRRKATFQIIEEEKAS